jgi:hypothetical protein
MQISNKHSHLYNEKYLHDLRISYSRLKIIKSKGINEKRPLKFKGVQT